MIVFTFLFIYKGFAIPCVWYSHSPSPSERFKCTAASPAGAGLGRARLQRGGHQGCGCAAEAPGLVSE